MIFYMYFSIINQNFKVINIINMKPCQSSDLILLVYSITVIFALCTLLTTNKGPHWN